MQNQQKQKISAFLAKKRVLFGVLGANVCVMLVFIVLMASVFWQQSKEPVLPITTVVQPTAPTPVQPSLPTPGSEPEVVTPSLPEPVPETPSIPEAPSTPAEVVDGKINLNTATESLLMELPGIGPQKAKAIIEYRQQTPFQTIDELQNVSGIGEKTFAKLQALITV